MAKELPLQLQEVLFATGNRAISKQISKFEKEGRLRKIAPRVYTPNLQEAPEVIIRRNLFTIIGRLFPGILLSHRSAMEFKPTATGDLFLTYRYKRKIELPGVTLHLMEGPGPLPGDNLLAEGLHVAQQARALLENFQESRKPGPASKTLTIPELEERLEQVIRINGDEGLNRLRDQARQIAGLLHWPKEFDKLNKLTGALLSTQPSRNLSTPLAIARATGHPYDPARLVLFEELFVALHQHTFRDAPEQNQNLAAFRNFAFFEAYFSNYIEGTEFEIGEAKQIIATNTPMPARDEDSHDILGTYKLLSNPDEMRLTPATPEELFHMLQYRHQVLLSARLSKKPGEFKDKNNRAGNTVFVDKTLVRGTLTKGFDYYRNLSDPFAKAVYMKFLVSEVHPFLDGNGRIARVMMNAELVKAGQTRIIIPTVFREDYTGALKLLSKQHSPETYIRMMTRAQLFSSTITGRNMDEMQARLEKSSAFLQPDEGKLTITTDIDAPAARQRLKKGRGPRL